MAGSQGHRDTHGMEEPAPCRYATASAPSPNGEAAQTRAELDYRMAMGLVGQLIEQSAGRWGGSPKANGP